MTFNKQYWIEQLTKEVGLEGVSYDELENHYVNFESPFGTESNSPTTNVNAKEYVDSQLLFIENEYKDFQNSLNDNTILPAFNSEFNDVDIFSRLNQTAEELDSVNLNTKDVISDLENNLFIKPVVQNIDRESVKYYEIYINNRSLIVAFNLNSCDLKTQDQINHLKNTSYFVEERNPLTFIGSEEIISYYQFANLVEILIRKKEQDLQTKISEDIKTEFDGVKLENFS